MCCPECAYDPVNPGCVALQTIELWWLAAGRGYTWALYHGGFYQSCRFNGGVGEIFQIFQCERDRNLNIGKLYICLGSGRL